MSLPSDILESLARRLDEAVRHTRPIPMLSLEHPDLTVDEAYAIQEYGIALREEHHERVVGMKMGLTSLAKARQMGVHTPIFGHLTDAMLLADGGTLPMARYGHPRVEPEIAFLLAEDLRGPVSPAQALAAVRGACCAIEILDSRYLDFKFKLADVVADNTSGARYVLGNRLVDPQSLDLGCLGMVMEIQSSGPSSAADPTRSGSSSSSSETRLRSEATAQSGSSLQIGCSAAIFEHPARSLAELANMLAPRGQHLKAGQVILTGGATVAVGLEPGDRVRLDVDGLGSASLVCG